MNVIRDIPSERLNDWMGFTLNPEQLRAAVAPLEPGVIIAGAGTGKTTVMQARVVWLVATGKVRPDQVLGLTFTTKATAELAGRVRDALGRARARGAFGTPAEQAGDQEGAEPTISTYHAFARRLVTEHGPLVGAEPSARVLDEAGAMQLAYRVVTRTQHSFEAAPGSPGELVRSLVALDSALAEHDVTTDELRQADAELLERLASVNQQNIVQVMATTARQRRDLATLVDELRSEKQRVLALDFADQLRWATQVARRYPQVGRDLRDRFRVVLLDEYQDTSVTQRVLMQHLFGHGHPVTAVGDPFQAIYGWRGASVRNIDHFPTDFPSLLPDGTSVPAARFGLSENRRSRQAILDVANRVAAPLRAAHVGAVELRAAPQADDSESPSADIVCALLDTDDEEAAWVADQVAGLIERGHQPGDVAVLMRKMTNVAPLRDALAVRNIPVEVVGVEGLVSLPEVVEVHSVLQLLHDPAANPACARLLTGPRWRIGPRDLRLLGERASEIAGGRSRERGGSVDDALARAVNGTDAADMVSLLDALDDLGDAPLSDEGRQRALQAAAELRALRRHVGEPLGDLVMRVVAFSGIDSELLAAGHTVHQQQLAAVHAFVSLAAEFRDLDGRSSLGGFLRFLADARRFEKEPEADLPSPVNSVRIMSMHKAKGLEFPVVVIPSLDDGTFPKPRVESWTKNGKVIPLPVRHEPYPEALPMFPPVAGDIRATDHTAFVAACRAAAALDETRLAYVAVTRAKSTLIASAARWVGTRRTMADAGEYLLAVQQACEVDGLGVVDRWSDGTSVLANPRSDTDPVPWPVVMDPGAYEARREAAAAVVARRAQVTELADCVTPAHPVVADWDRDLAVLLDEARRDNATERAVPLPSSLSTSDLQRLLDDEESFVRDLVRPMPRQPSPAARRGTRFHAWVESQYGMRPLLEPDDLPGAADADIDSDDELDAMQQTFLQLEYADLTPHGIEVDFALPLAGRVIPGRIDAVFRHPHPSGDPARDRWEVVDWKTNRAPTADPLQLAVYRVAWAERMGVPLQRVDASFVYVRLGEVRRFGDAPGASPLPDRAELERMLSGE